MKTLLLYLGLGSVLCFGGSLPVLAQEGGAQGEEGEADADSAWDVDEDGLRQWKTDELECTPCLGTGSAPCRNCEMNLGSECAECDGEREAPCRACGGKGEQYDPLEEMVCPYCDGSALWVCALCRGKGKYFPSRGGKKGQRCGPCKTSGRLPCKACKGKRRVRVLKVGSKTGKASLKQLNKAREVLVDAARQLKAFRSQAKESSDSKAFHQTISKAMKTAPALKDMEKMIDEGLTALRIAAQYTNYESRVVKEFHKFRDRSVAYIEHQVELVDLCIERQEFNEKVKERR